MAAVGHQTQLQPPKLNERSKPPVTQLEFHQAMTDFKTMFPEIDEDVIEVVLRANSGAVDATIDQLLSMTTDNENERLRAELDATENNELPPSYSPATPPPSYHQAVPYAPSPSRHLPVTRKFASTSPLLARHAQKLPSKQVAKVTPPQKKENASLKSESIPLRIQKDWKPPLVGPLPSSFLRIDSTSRSRTKRGKFMTVLSSAMLQKRMQENERQRRNTIGAEDPELAQYLEDERIALFLQNEEFVRELMGNKEFMSTLDKDTSVNSGSMTLQSKKSHTLKSSDKAFGDFDLSKSDHQAVGRSLSAEDSDAAFRERLKNMGKLSRRKFAQLASLFSRRKRAFKPILGDGINPSRDNLLSHDDDYAALSEEDSDSEWNKKGSWNSHHGGTNEESDHQHNKHEYPEERT